MNEKHGPNGFLIGLILGGAVGALVSSKRGRQILKDLADYGLEYIGKTIDMEDIESILNNDEEEMMAGEMETEEVTETPKHTAPEKTEVTSKIYEPKPPEPQRRRFFRRIKK